MSITYPDSDMLEGLVRAAKESNEIRMKTAIRLVPDSVERRIVFCG